MSKALEMAVAKFAVAFVAVAMLVSLVAPVAQAQTTEELQAMINDLLAQVAALQGTVGSGDSMAAGVCPFTWTRTLNMGATGADVMTLQKFLNADPETRVAVSGAGSAGNETSYYGPATGAAVAKFQTKYRADILTPLGLVNATTFFGNSTMAKANKLCATAPVVTDDSSDDSTDDSDDDSTDTTLKGGESSIDNSFNAKAGDDTDLEEGQEDAPVMDVEFDVEDGDIKVGRVDVAVDHTSGTETNPWDVFETVSLWVDGDMIAEMDANSKSDWEKDKPATGDYRLRFTGLSQIWREDDQAEFTVGVTLANSIDGDTGTWDIFIPTDGIRGIDGAGINQYTGNTSDTVSFDFGAQGGDDELIVKSSSDDPAATTLKVESNAKSDWTSVFVYDLDTDDSISDITVETLAVGVVVSSSTFDGLISDARLTVDGTTYTDFTYTNGASVTLLFDIDDDLVIDAGARVTAELELKFNQLAAGNEGVEVYATSTGSFNVADGADDLSGSQLSGSATGETHTLRTEGAVTEFVSSTETLKANTDSTTADDEGVFTIKVDVTAFETDLWINKTAASGTTMGTAGVNFIVEDANGNQVGAGTSSASLTSTADTDGTRFKVNEGETETFTLTVNYDPTTAGFYQVQFHSVNWAKSNANPTTQQATVPAADYESDQISI